MFKRILYSFTAFALAIGLLGCTPQEEQEPVMEVPAVEKAVAVLHPTEGHDVSGVVTFTKEAEGVRVVARVEGLTPGDHGFHVHEYGDCSAADGTSAGGHYNPTDMPHGGPDAEQHHIGDLGNITADETGVATMDEVFGFLSLSGENSIIGRGLIVHQGSDDLTSQPTGAAGARVACAVIGIGK